MNTLLNIVDKLPDGLVELYQSIDEHTTVLEIPYLVIGATARDIVLVHGYNANIERGTRDIDFGIQVQTWEQFNQLKTRLLESGYVQHKAKAHQLNMTDSSNMQWEIDIVPFGEIAQTTNKIAWPPNDDLVMSVMGFDEAFENALAVRISETPELLIKVASPAGMFILKIISWFERGPDLRKKDASDIYYLIKHYAKIPEIFDVLYEQDFMEIQNYEELAASAMKLAHDAKLIALPDTLTFINQQLFANEHHVDNLILDISRSEQITYEDTENLLTIIKQQFQKTDARTFVHP
jgi:predicted nucleotidyltransferase